jgi:hypothetical protein
MFNRWNKIELHFALSSDRPNLKETAVVPPMGLQCVKTPKQCGPYCQHFHKARREIGDSLDTSLVDIMDALGGYKKLELRDTIICADGWMHGIFLRRVFFTMPSGVGKPKSPDIVLLDVLCNDCVTCHGVVLTYKEMS